MSRKLFSEEEIAELKENPHVTTVTRRTVNFTAEFKQILYESMMRGERLATILEIIANAGVSVEYTYAFLGTRMAGAFMIFRVDDNAKAAAALEAAGIKTVEQSDMF